jgi:hypothetical protein
MNFASYAASTFAQGEERALLQNFRAYNFSSGVPRIKNLISMDIPSISLSLFSSIGSTALVGPGPFLVS